jgi:hypothetical protein
MCRARTGAEAQREWADVFVSLLRSAQTLEARQRQRPDDAISATSTALRPWPTTTQPVRGMLIDDVGGMRHEATIAA